MSSSKLVSKAIVFTAKANEQHNSIKIRNVLKWLKSGHEVKVQINGSVDKKLSMENIYKQLERDVKSGALFKQKLVKDDSIKVQLVPTESAASFEVAGGARVGQDVEKEISDIVADKDIFSPEFEDELEKSIREEKTKGKKK